VSPPHATRDAARQGRPHVQEITLHQLASVHPSVVALRCVIEKEDCTFVVMDHCPDGDLFVQILHKRRYLGRDDLIEYLFLQSLEAVTFFHPLGLSS
jgi:serine/threonine protein kinase